MRYIDADKLLESVTKNDFNDWLDYDIFQHLVEEAHTADVVPKSEVERLVDKWIGEENLTQDEKTLRLIEALRDEAKRYERYYFNHEYDKLIGAAKAEVAREIIDKIESVMFDRFSNIMLGEDIRLCLAELQKKYTEEQV